MIPLKNRIKKRSEIDLIFKEGRTLCDGFFCLKFVTTKSSLSRFAFSIGLGYSKKATDRNKLRRQMRQALASRLEEIESGFDGVFFLNKNCRGAQDFKLVEKAVISLLFKGGILKK